jgi:hypothetical protein
MVIGEQPDQAELARMRKIAQQLEAEDQRLGIELRQQVIRQAAVLCTCRQRFGWNRREQGEPPPQAGCIIHGGYMIHPKTGELL